MSVRGGFRVRYALCLRWHDAAYSDALASTSLLTWVDCLISAAIRVVVLPCCLAHGPLLSLACFSIVKLDVLCCAQYARSSGARCCDSRSVSLFIWSVYRGLRPTECALLNLTDSLPTLSRRGFVSARPAVIREAMPSLSWAAICAGLCSAIRSLWSPIRPVCSLRFPKCSQTIACTSRVCIESRLPSYRPSS